MANLRSLTILAIAAFVFTGIAQIKAADKEKAKSLLEAIENEVKGLTKKLFNILNVEFDGEYYPVYRPYQIWEGNSVKIIQAMIKENDECKLTETEAQKKVQNILTSLDQAKTESDKAGEGLEIPNLLQTIDMHVAFSKSNIYGIAEELYEELPDTATAC